METALLGLGALGLVLGLVWLLQRRRARVLFISTLPEAVNDLLILLGHPTTPGAMGAAAIYLEELHVRFQAHNGQLPGAREERAPDQGRWWRYESGVWVLYRVTDSSRWSVRQPVRTVTIVGFEPALPVA